MPPRKRNPHSGGQPSVSNSIPKPNYTVKKKQTRSTSTQPNQQSVNTSQVNDTTQSVTAPGSSSSSEGMSSSVSLSPEVVAAISSAVAEAMKATTSTSVSTPATATAPATQEDNSGEAVSAHVIEESVQSVVQQLTGGTAANHQLDQPMSKSPFVCNAVPLGSIVPDKVKSKVYRLGNFAKYSVFRQQLQNKTPGERVWAKDSCFCS